MKRGRINKNYYCIRFLASQRNGQTLAGKITSDFLTTIIEVRFSCTHACVEYKYFNFIYPVSNITGLFHYRTDAGTLKGEFGSELCFLENVHVAKRFYDHVLISPLCFSRNNKNDLCLCPRR